MGSPFASFTTEAVTYPSDPPLTAVIQRVSGRGLERAQAAAAAEIVRGRGFAQKIERLVREGATDDAAQAALSDPLNGYDRTTINIEGIVSWDATHDGKPHPVTSSTVADLDDDAAEFFARAILKLTKPSLFAAAEAVRKNG